MSIEPVRKQIVVETTQERAFHVFTEGIDKWWIREHHIGKAPLKRVVMEPRAEGRWYEIGEDGSECNWGRVVVWDPPRRLLLNWQINAQWQYDASFVTDVEITFAAEGAKRTRVSLEHRNMERFGDAAERMRASFESGGGWTDLLARFEKAAQS